ncbi:MAG: DUF3048 domain-containing protein [Anaerolineaceae bacterium]
MKKTNLLIAITSLVLISITLTACGGANAQVPQATLIAESAQKTLTALKTLTPFGPSTNTPAPTATITPTPAPAEYGPSGFPSNVDPLTGLVVSDPTILDRRPVMIKVSNWPRIGRPHYGLSYADLVFEYYIGGGMNRFVGLFYGQNAEKVGPIRSGRYVDAQLVPMYQGILGFESAYLPIYQKIVGTLGNRAIVGGPENCPAICDDGRGTVISVFSDTAALSKLATERGVSNSRQNLDGMRFDTDVPQNGKAAQNVLVQFNIQDRGEWRYDAASGKYLRWIEDDNNELIPLTDALTDKQLSFSNVVVIYANYIEYAASMHDITLADNTQGAKAYLFRDGQAYEGIWKSAGADKPMQFFNADGSLMALKPGNSWIAILGSSTTLTQPETDRWNFQFNLP